ncbi:MAG TPA: hypothetical protein VJI69_08045 [Bacteroidia bacterium]|nr:hypothetical protein [Bacteroidia bacterium]
MMNKKITLAFFLLLNVSAFTQNIDYANIKVDYTRLPLKPVSKDVVNYQPLIIADYLAKIEQQKVENQNAAAKAEADYQQALKQYWTKRNQDSLLYENSLNVWFRLTPQQQAVTPRPQMPASTVPVKAITNEAVLEKTFNTDLLASTYIKLEGFTKLPEKALIIQMNLSGFEKDEAKSATQKKQIKRGDGKTVDSTVFVYQFNYRHIIKLKIIQPDGKFLMDEAYGPSLGFTTYTSKFFANQIDLDNYWKSAQANEITNTQEKIVIDNLKSINEMINNNYGYVQQARGVVVGYVNEKKMYDDFKDALNNAKNAYAIIGKKETSGQGKDYLQKAVATWETAMKESNPSNKKARIDEDVTECLLMDLSEAYIWLEDFTKAQEYLTKLDGFKLSMKEKNIKAGTKAFLADQSLRISANK